MWGFPSAEIRIEEGESAELATCFDCGKRNLAVWGFVSRKGMACGAYYANWSEGHHERGVQILLGIGSFIDGSTSSQRKMIAIDCRMGEGRPNYMVLDASKIKLDDEASLGKGLTREEMMNDPLKNEYFKIMDQITSDDGRIKSFLTTPPAIKAE